MRLLQDITQKAGEAGLPFLIIGGYAVLAHGYVRATDDLDLLVQRGRRAEWKKLMEAYGMTVKHDAATFLQFHAAPGGRIDVDLMFVSEGVFAQLAAAAVAVKVEGVSVSVVALLHLVALKCHALQHSKSLRRLKDLDDLIQLISINRLDLNDHPQAWQPGTLRKTPICLYPGVTE
jgi:predicted nucleotidyltransferase